MLTDIGLGKRIASIVAKRLVTMLAERGEKPDALLISRERYTAHENISQGEVILDGSENASVQFATCCRPVPGDAVVGYLGRGEGLVVHAEDCAVAKRLQYKDSGERFISVEWAKEPVRPFEAGVLVTVTNGKGVPVLAHEPDPAVLRKRHDRDRADMLNDLEGRFAAVSDPDAVYADPEGAAGKTFFGKEQLMRHGSPFIGRLSRKREQLCSVREPVIRHPGDPEQFDVNILLRGGQRHLAAADVCGAPAVFICSSSWICFCSSSIVCSDSFHVSGGLGGEAALGERGGQSAAAAGEQAEDVIGGGADLFHRTLGHLGFILLQFELLALQFYAQGFQSSYRSSSAGRRPAAPD